MQSYYNRQEQILRYEYTGVRLEHGSNHSVKYESGIIKYEDVVTLADDI